MGILPLQFVAGQDADSLELNGSEHFDIEIPKGSLKPGRQLMVKVVGGDFATKFYKYYVMIYSFDNDKVLGQFRISSLIPWI
jgi:aconitase A